MHTNEVMLVPLQGGVDGFAAGQLAAAHQPGLQKQLQAPVHGGQARDLLHSPEGFFLQPLRGGPGQLAWLGGPP